MIPIIMCYLYVYRILNNYEYTNGQMSTQWQTWYKNRTMIHTAGSPGNQPVCYKNQLKNQACYLLDLWTVRQLTSRNASKKPNKSTDNWPQIIRTWLLTDSFLNFCTHFNLRSEKAKYVPLATRTDCRLLPVHLWLPQAPGCPSECPRASLVPTEALPPSACFQSLPSTREGDWLSFNSKFWIKSLCFFSFDWSLFIFHKWQQWHLKGSASII